MQEDRKDFSDTLFYIHLKLAVLWKGLDDSFVPESNSFCVFCFSSQVVNVKRISGKYLNSNPVIVTEQFPAGSKFLGLPHIESHLKTTLWDLVIAYARENRYTHAVREYGCLIYLNQDGEYFCGEILEGEPVILDQEGVGGDVVLEESTLTDIHNPLRTLPIAVGCVHTHYPLTWAAGDYYSKCGPSETDLNCIWPGILYDYVSDKIIGHDENDPKRVYSYGPTKRAIWTFN